MHIEEPVAATLSGARPKLSLPVPPGHDYDVANAEVLLTRAAIRDGEIVLPDGIRYRVLVMPEGLRVTQELLEKLRDCVAAGMWLAGTRSFSNRLRLRRCVRASPRPTCATTSGRCGHHHH